MESTALFTLRLLGPLDIRVGGQAPALRRKERALLAYLAAIGQAQRRDTLAEMFCAEADNPAGVLRLLLSRIRRQIGPQTLQTEGERVWLRRQATPVDYVEFERILDGDTSSQPLAQLEAALDLYRGEFVAGLSLPDAPEFELWLLGERTRVRLLYERGLAEIVSRLTNQQEHGRAIQRTQHLLQSNPLLEEAHAHLIWLYAQIGQRDAALAQFEQCREILRRELAVEPTPELQALQAEVVTGRLGIRMQASSALTDLPPRPGDFVGRLLELRQLQQAYQAAAATGTVVLIEAVAGGGKTRLIHELTCSVQAQVLRGRCYESTTVLPYHPWIELLETYQAGLGDAELYTLSPFALDYMLRLLPGLARRLGRSAPPLPPTAGGELERFFTAAAEFLFQLPGRQAQRLRLIILDDLQWADGASLRLFHFLARRLQQVPVLLIGAFRSEEAEGVPELDMLLRDLKRLPHRHLRLPPLSPPAIADLIASLWPDLSQSDQPYVATVLARATGGNPLFVSEVLRELAGNTALPAELPLPASVRDLIQRRLRQLPESSRQAIETLAVFDMAATISEIRQASARSEDEAALAIDLGLSRGLLQAQPHGWPTRYDFLHDLIRQAVATGLSQVRRRLLHRRVAETLAQAAARLQPDLRRALAGRILRHALEGESYSLVFQWGALAAEHAFRLHAYADALSALEATSNAFEQLCSDPDFDLARSTRQQIELLLNRGALVPYVGRPIAEYSRLIEAAAELLARYPDEQRLALYDLRHSELLSMLDQYDPAAEMAIKAYERYIKLGDHSGAAQSLYQAGNCKITVSHNRAGRQLFEHALALHRAIGDSFGQGWSLSGLALSELNLGQVAAAMAHIQNAIELSRLQADRLVMARTFFTLAMAWAFYHHTANMQTFAEQSLALYREIGIVLGSHRPLLLLAESYRLRGWLDQASSIYDQMFNDPHVLQDTWLTGWAAQGQGRIALARSDLVLAESWLQRAYQMRRGAGEQANQVSDLTWLGRLKLVQGRVPDALSYTSQAISQLETLLGECYVWEMPDVFLAHAEALAASGTTAQVPLYIQRAYDTLMQFVAQIDDQQLKQEVLAYRIYARVISARQTGSIEIFRYDA